jgi:hypothetical protein
MAKTHVRGTGPVEITDKNGNLASLPLTAVYFEAGQIKAEGSLYTANQKAFDPLLQYLADQGLLLPDVEPPPVAALVITAENPGAAGNHIQLDFGNVQVGANKTVFDATLTQRDTHDHLTSTDLAGVLGTNVGTSAELVFLSTSGTTLPADGTYTADATGVVTVPQAGAAGKAFTLTFRVPDAAASMTVDISNSDATTGTFDLSAAWSKKAAGIDADGLNTSFGKMITVASPQGGTPTTVPAPGTVVLSGGADPAAAKPASATAMAQP